MVKLPIRKITYTKRPFMPVKTKASGFKDLVASIERLGVVTPIAVDENFHLIDGMWRLFAAKAAGLKEIPAIVCDSGRAKYLSKLAKYRLVLEYYARKGGRKAREALRDG